MEFLLKLDKFYEKTRIDEGCLIWTAAKNIDGYGRFNYQGKLWMSHRLVWTWINGDIPEGMHVLHKCDTPSCVNIDHLFLGTNDDNIADKVLKNRQARNYKTHCKRGHEYTKENTFMRKQGWKECRTCVRMNQRAARARNKVSSQ
jgi:hypothetical protein